MVQSEGSGQCESAKQVGSAKLGKGMKQSKAK